MNVMWRKLNRFSAAVFELLTLWVLVHAVSATPLRAEVPSVDLLRHAQTRVADTTLPLKHHHLLRILRDGDVKTPAVLPVGVEAQVGMTFELPEVATLSQLIAYLPPSSQDHGSLKIQVLVSTISPHAGFRAVTAKGMTNRDDQLVYALPSVAARWIRLEIRSPAEIRDVSLAEVKLVGRWGLPQTTYAFKKTPATAEEVLARLGKLGAVDVRLSHEEVLLLDDARDGQLDDWTLVEAALLAEGMERGERRQDLMKRIATIATAAGRHLDQDAEPFQRASALLRWMYAEGYLKKYSSGQSSLAKLLHEGTYNCVSSTILYSIIGRRLGLDVRAVEVPDHVLAMVYDGNRHADVETTIANGFRPANQTIEDFHSLTGLQYVVSDLPEKRRSLTLPGLLALVPYNRGVELAEQRSYALALGAYFRAMSLDGDNATAVKNALVTLAAWSRVAAESQDYRQFLALIQVGLQLAPSDSGFLHSRIYGWQMWINDTVQRGDSERAIQLVRRAAREVSAEQFEPLVTWVYISPAEAKVAKGDFAGAVGLTENAEQTLSGQSLREIQEYRANLMQRWYVDELQAGRHVAAAKVLDQALRLPEPKKARIEQSYAYLAEQWLSATRKQDGSEVAEKLYHLLSQRYGQIEVVRDVLRADSQREIQSLVEGNQFSAAWRRAERIAMNDREHGNTLRVQVLSYWGVQRSSAKDWSAAAKLFRRARSYGDSKQLAQNEKSALTRWVLQSSGMQPWTETMKILDDARGRFPLDQDIVDLGVAMWWSQAEPHVKAGQWDKALVVIKQARARYPQNPLLRQNEKHVWSQKVRPAFRSQRWEEGLVVMTAARLRFPEESTFIRNQLTCFRQLVKGQIEAGDWEAVTSTLQRARKQHPREQVFRTQELEAWRSWIDQYQQGNDAPRALVVIKRALQRFPDDASLKSLLREAERNAPPRPLQ